MTCFGFDCAAQEDAEQIAVLEREVKEVTRGISEIMSKNLIRRVGHCAKIKPVQ